jgi:hypothetical protein
MTVETRARQPPACAGPASHRSSRRSVGARGTVGHRARLSSVPTQPQEHKGCGCNVTQLAHNRGHFRCHSFGARHRSDVPNRRGTTGAFIGARHRSDVPNWRGGFVRSARGSRRRVEADRQRPRPREHGMVRPAARWTTRRPYNASSPEETQDGSVASARFERSQETRYPDGLLPGGWPWPARR